jgi:hypothetical protein
MLGNITALHHDGSPVFNHRYLERRRVMFPTGERIVGEDDVWADKDIIFDLHTIPELHTGPIGNPIANYFVFLINT